MSFNPYSYTSKTSVNFTSMGFKRGNFSIDSKGVQSMYQAIADDEMATFCMIEKKTPFFKLFWDFDIKNLTHIFKKTNIANFWSYLVETLVSVLQKYINEKDNKTFKYIYSDRKDTEYGIHVYFPNIVISSEYCMALREQLIKKVIQDNEYKFLDEAIWGDIIDASVFKGNGLRLLFQKKVDLKTKQHEKGHYVINIEKSTLTNIPKNKFQQLQLTSIRSTKTALNVELTINEKTNLPKLDILKEKARIKEQQDTDNLNKPVNPDDIRILKEQSFNMSIVNQFANNLSINRITNYDTWLQFVFLCRNYGWTELAHEISKKANNYSSKAVNTYLKSPAKGKLYTIGSLIYWSKQDNLAKHMKIIKNTDMAHLMTKEMTYDHSDSFEKYADEVYENDYVNKLDLDNFDTFIIKAATGTGKTEKIIESINKLVKTKRADSISVLASRIVLAINIHGRFQEPLHNQTKPMDLGMKLYSDVDKKKNLWKENRLIQTPDSLIHMIKPDAEIDFDIYDEDGSEYIEDLKLACPDVLFIDEIESLLDYVCTSSTLSKSRREVFTILNTYISKAKYVFLVDSNVTIPVCNHIKKLRKHHNINVIYNKKKTNNTTYHLTYNESYFTQKIIDCVRKGKNVFIGSDSKKQTEMLNERLTEIGAKVKVYNCDTDDKSRNALAEVNTEWVKYNAVICSPTILYGVDFQANHFDLVFGYYTKTINASSVYQQLNRVRKIRSKTAYIYVQDYRNSNLHPMPTKTMAIGKYYFKYQKEFKLTLQLLAFDYLHLHRLNENDLFTHLYLHFQAEINRCGNNYEERLSKFLTEFGGKLYLMENGRADKAFINNNRTIREKLEITNIEDLIKASKKIDKITEINEKKNKTTEDKKILTAFRICKKLKLNELNGQFLKQMNHIKNFDTLVQSFDYFTPLEELVLRIKDNTDNNVELFNKKKQIVESAINLFFTGVLSNESVFLNNKTKATPNQALWAKNNLPDILYCFKSIRQGRVKCDTHVNLMKLVNNIVSDFFGGFIEIHRGERVRNQINKVQSTGNHWTIDNNKYIELMLNAGNVPNNVYKLIEPKHDIECIYTKLHGYKRIEDIVIFHNEIQKDHDILAANIDFLD